MSKAMEFLVDLKPGTFLHKRGRARNAAIVRMGELVFRWDGRRQIYSAGFLRDLSGDILQHPDLRVAGMSRPPAVVAPEDVFKPEVVEKPKGKGKRPAGWEIVAKKPEPVPDPA